MGESRKTPRQNNTNPQPAAPGGPEARRIIGRCGRMARLSGQGVGGFLLIDAMLMPQFF